MPDPGSRKSSRPNKNSAPRGPLSLSPRTRSLSFSLSISLLLVLRLLRGKKNGEERAERKILRLSFSPSRRNRARSTFRRLTEQKTIDRTGERTVQAFLLPSKLAFSRLSSSLSSIIVLTLSLLFLLLPLHRSSLIVLRRYSPALSDVLGIEEGTSALPCSAHGMRFKEERGEELDRVGGTNTRAFAAPTRTNY